MPATPELQHADPGPNQSFRTAGCPDNTAHCEKSCPRGRSAGGAAKQLVVKLGAKGKTLPAKQKTLSATPTTPLKDAAGNMSTKAQVIKIKLKPKPKR